MLRQLSHYLKISTIFYKLKLFIFIPIMTFSVAYSTVLFDHYNR